MFLPLKIALSHGGIWTPSKYTVPWAHNWNGISIGSAVLAQLTAMSGMPWHVFPLKLPLHMGLWTSSNTCFLGPPESITQRARRSVQPFLHSSLQSDPILYNEPPVPSSKLSLPVKDLDPHLIHGSMGPPEFSAKMASRSVRPFLQGSLLWQTDRPRYSVCNNRQLLPT